METTGGGVTIREMGCHDVEANMEDIDKLLSEIYSYNFGLTDKEGYKIAQEKVRSLKQYVLNDDTKVYCAYYDGVFVGFVWVYIYDFLENSRVHVNYIAVKNHIEVMG